MTKLEQLLSSNGDGTGTVDMATTAGVYTITPPADWTYQIHRVNVYIEDDAKFAGNKYAGAAALANGIVITSENADRIITTHSQQPIKKIGHWGLLGGVDMVITDFVAGNDIALVRWSFNRYDKPITVKGDNGEFLKVWVKDSLATLVSHIMQVQGTVFWSG